MWSAAAILRAMFSLSLATEVRYRTGRPVCRTSDNEASLSCSVSFRACPAESLNRTCTTTDRYDIRPPWLHNARIVPQNTNRWKPDSDPMTSRRVLQIAGLRSSPCSGADRHRQDYQQDRDAQNALWSLGGALAEHRSDSL
jgi:hypothetical protein